MRADVFLRRNPSDAGVRSESGGRQEKIDNAAPLDISVYNPLSLSFSAATAAGTLLYTRTARARGNLPPWWRSSSQGLGPPRAHYNII